jgi:hypothetical protein
MRVDDSIGMMVAPYCFLELGKNGRGRGKKGVRVGLDAMQCRVYQSISACSA